MRSFIVLFLFVIAYALPGKSASAVKDSTLLSEKELRYDLDFLRIVLEKAHPSLYRYITKPALDSAFDKAYAEIEKPSTEIGFWQICRSIIGQIGCGHTNIMPSMPGLKNINESNLPVIPFYVAVHENRLYIQRYIQAPGNSEYRVNDEILSINGMPADVILTTMRRLTSSEGYSNSYRDFKLETGEFNWLHAILNRNSPEFEMVLQRHKKSWSTTVKSRVTTGNLKPLTLTEEANQPILSKSDQLPSTAILSIRRFTYKNFNEIHKRIFSQIESDKIKNLVIDVRTNSGGGADVVIDLMKYLTRKKSRFTTITEGVVDFEKFIALFKNKLPPDLSVLKSVAHKRFEREYVGNKPFSPYPNAFKGKVYVLVNRGTYSSSALFASSLKAQTDCIVVGEETGGGNWGCSGGATVDVTLPNTGLRLKLPLMWTYSAAKGRNEGRGLIPDYTVRTRSAWIDGALHPRNDIILSKLAELIVPGTQ